MCILANFILLTCTQDTNIPHKILNNSRFHSFNKFVLRTYVPGTTLGATRNINKTKRNKQQQKTERERNPCPHEASVS